MPESDRTSIAARGGLTEPYARQSMRPLESLIFLLPLVIAYEVGSIAYLGAREPGALGAIRAERLLNAFFELFGVAGLALPALLLVTVLLVCHLLEKRPSRPRIGVILGMYAESAAWTLPLLMLAVVMSTLTANHPSLGMAAGVWPAMAWPSRLTIAIGAGLYEELLFRMIGIALVHGVVLAMGAPDRLAGAAAVIITAVAFALYHAPHTPGRFIYYALAGVFLGVLYVLRGFGIAAGTHAAYDAIVLVLLSGPPGHG